ncbi:MAG TPA: MBL fold metallo-hydrolase [Anaerolineales bacterium]|nr:MBL fold metallo-hydrolase [Anaerolineales bacterium]
MPLQITSLSLGFIGTNCYLVADSETKDAVVIDPGGDAPVVLSTAREMGVSLRAIWLTHAHFDHWGGVAGIVRMLNVPVALHSLDLPLYRNLGGAKQWGIPMEPGPEPAILLDQLVSSEKRLEVGNLKFEVRFAPGHTPGHVAFYQKEAGAIFGGDVLFQNSIGRTDLPGGDFDTLINSIRAQFLTLPDSTVVYSGHGPETTIAEEKQHNPFL